MQEETRESYNKNLWSWVSAVKRERIGQDSEEAEEKASSRFS